MEEVESNPGPGEYVVKSSVGDTYRFTMRGRERFGSATGKAEDPATKNEPAPNQYPKALSFLNSNERRPPQYSLPKAGNPKAV